MTKQVHNEVLEGFQDQLFLTEEEKQQAFWEQDGVHFIKPLTPLFASYMVTGLTTGTKEAFEKLKLPMKQFKAKVSDGYFYQNVPMHDNPLERVEMHKAAMGPVFPRATAILDEKVEQVLMPFYNRLDAYKDEALTLEGAEEKVMELYEYYAKIWSIHFEVVMPRMSIGMALEEVYDAALQTKNTAEVYELLLGTMNKSLETDRELWKLSQVVRGSGVLSAIFAENEAEELVEALKAVKEGQEFLVEVHGFLNIYGYRTAISHEFADETWVENPAHALKVVKNYLVKEFDFDADLQEVVAKREKKVQDVLNKMPEGQLKEAFKGLHGMALQMWGLDEDHHFYIDAMFPAKARLFLLNVGDLLVNHSVIADKEDISFLYLDELVAALRQPTPLHELVAKRRADYQHQVQQKAVPFFGTPPQGPVDPMVERVFGTKNTELDEQTKTFSGYAGSQGTYRGTVKVVQEQSEFGKITKGDVLVCRTTTPPWTVLFNLAGAIITDRGGILSHAATVAREYEVPCVVGAKIATSVLKDGDVVTVNGTTGEVTIHESK